MSRCEFETQGIMELILDMQLDFTGWFHRMITISLRSGTNCVKSLKRSLWNIIRPLVTRRTPNSNVTDAGPVEQRERAGRQPRRPRASGFHNKIRLKLIKI